MKTYLKPLGRIKMFSKRYKLNKRNVVNSTRQKCLQESKTIFYKH